jgi:osmotically-inducible protein OsmY
MFGIGGGPSKQEKVAYQGLNQLSGFGASHGENDIANSEKWLNAILSGDRGAISTLLAPQISGIKQRGQNQLQTSSQFGNRSGGTNAGNQMSGDNITSQINDMIDQLTQGAIGESAQLGTNLTGQASGNYVNLFGEAKTMQEQEQARWNDIFKSVAQVASTVGGFFPSGSMGDKIFSGISAGMGG